MQTLITLIIVGIAALYMVRHFVQAGRSFLDTKSGCPGCGKCSFAQQGKIRKPRTAVGMEPPRRDLISLSEIKVVGKNNDARTK